MNSPRKQGRLHRVRQHRKTWYERYLDKLMHGKCKPGDVTMRWNKYKAVK